MTQKELLYVEDAITHEQTIITDLNESMNLVEEDLKHFFESRIEKHTQTKQNLINLMEEVSNE